MVGVGRREMMRSSVEERDIVNEDERVKAELTLKEGRKKRRKEGVVGWGGCGG